MNIKNIINKKLKKNHQGKVRAAHETATISFIVAASKVLICVSILIYCLSLLVPLFWMLITSLKDQYDYATNLFGFPTIYKFSNYKNVLKFLPVKATIVGLGTVQYSIGLMTLNSLLRAVFCPLLIVMCQAMVSYVLSKYKFVGNNVIYMIGIVVMITPIIGSLPSAMQVAKAVGTYDNMFMNIITCSSNIFGLYFLILYGMFKGVPWEYAEAAFIDGASDYTVFFKIMLPMALPTCAVLFVLSFLGVWNDYATPLIWLPSYPNLAYALYILQINSSAGAVGATTPMIMAGFAIIMIPTVLLYFISQNLIVSKLNVGGLKG